MPQSPDYVMGIMNLRGKIVTVMDTGKRLGLSPIRQSHTMRTIIVKSDDESVSLMVDRIGNVISVAPDRADSPPANIGEIPGRCFDAVYKTKDRLVGLLALEDLLR